MEVPEFGRVEGGDIGGATPGSNRRLAPRNFLVFWLPLHTPDHYWLCLLHAGVRELRAGSISENYLPPAVSNLFELAKGVRVRHVWPRP